MVDGESARACARARERERERESVCLCVVCQTPMFDGIIFI